MVKPDFEQMVEKTHLAVREFYRGNPEPYNKLYSLGQDVSLLGAQGGISVGSKEVSKHLTSRASWFQAGHNVSFERLVKFSAQDLGYVVEVERFDARVKGTDEIVHVALRATTIFRLENEEWKVVHRIADPLVSRISPATYRSLTKHNAERAHAKYEIDALKVKVAYEIEDGQKQERVSGYVKGSDFDNWHWCKNCTQYPLYVKEGRFDRPHSKLCPQCKALEDNKDCKTQKPSAYH